MPTKSCYLMNRSCVLDLLCSVMHVFPPRFVEKTKKHLQDFVIVNEERKPLILTLWEEFLENEAPYLVENVHNMPIILGMRLSVNTFYGLSIGTVPNSTILFEPPIPQAKQLMIWINNNKEYIESVVTEKLYEKAKQAIAPPLSFQIRKISQILSLTEMVKSFWIRATLKITDSEHRLYFLACPGCSKASGGAYKYEFTCFYCNNDFPSPKPLLRFQADLYDGTGNLRAFVEHNEAKILLGMSGEEIIEAEQQFLLQIRTSKNELRGRVFVRHTIIACLPTSDSSSTSHSSEEKSTSLHTHKDHEADIAMIESQESTSKTPEEHLAIELVEHQIASSGKRKLEAKKDMTKEGLKHSKQD
ncbi:replication protein A 70 kDa DNA-binding subunit D-like isoform X2 [Primulina tabacum]|uniref:replication protein A 70 kDa DNA-binding subunit D-like isoform X2 n=1 Tax=Primulina tabacum TaxID=48773 RepID=UPI003F59FA9D